MQFAHHPQSSAAKAQWCVHIGQGYGRRDEVGRSVPGARTVPDSIQNSRKCGLYVTSAEIGANIDAASPETVCSEAVQTASQGAIGRYSVQFGRAVEYPCDAQYAVRITSNQSEIFLTTTAPTTASVQPLLDYGVNAQMGSRHLMVQLECTTEHRAASQRHCTGVLYWWYSWNVQQGTEQPAKDTACAVLTVMEC